MAESTDIAIQIRDLSKVYHYNPKLNQNFRERFFDSKQMPESKSITALKDINIDIESGTVLGIIGDNGSGKSTLLKVISGITQPTTGSVRIEGRVASILEVGTGFHPDLTGKENIFLSGALMGMPKDEIWAKFDNIVQFSELDSYIDLAVKHYSSGMFMRLAFSVVAYLKSDIVLLDEVFSVGDFTFRNKSLDKVIEMSKSDRTMIMVSHDMNSLQRTCDHILELSNGRMTNFGPVSKVVSNYVETKILSTIDNEQVVSEDPDEEESEDREKIADDVNGAAKDKKETGNQKTGDLLAVKEGEVIVNKTNEDKDKLEDFTEPVMAKVLTEEERKEQERKERLNRTPKKFKSILTWKDGYTVRDKDDIVLYKLACIGSINKPPEYQYEDTLELVCHFEKKLKGKVGLAFLLLLNLEEQVFSAYSGYSDDREEFGDFEEPGKYEVSCTVPSHMLNTGIYSLSVFFVDDSLEESFSLINKVFFKVVSKVDQAKEFMDNGRYMGALKPRFDWNVKREVTS